MDDGKKPEQLKTNHNTAPTHMWCLNFNWSRKADFQT